MRENCYREIETHEIEIKNRNGFCNKNNIYAVGKFTHKE